MVFQFTRINQNTAHVYKPSANQSKIRNTAVFKKVREGGGRGSASIAMAVLQYATVSMEDIPPKLVLNWDQTGLKIIPSSTWTMERQVAKRAEMLVVNDKATCIYTYMYDVWVMEEQTEPFSTEEEEN